MIVPNSRSGLDFAFDCFAKCHLYLHLVSSPAAAPLAFLQLRFALLDGEDEERKNYLTILLALVFGPHDTSTRYTYTTHTRTILLSYSSYTPHSRCLVALNRRHKAQCSKPPCLI